MARVLAFCLVVAGILAPGANAARVRQQSGMPAVHNRTLLRGATVESIPMYMYKQDCFKKRPVLLATGAHAKTSVAMFPGAGMEPGSIEPFKTVLKDGFYHVDCVKDYMYYFGDKFGDHKWDYKLGEVSNVSIVLYDEMVSKQDRDPMTHAVCFAFCRTVPDMVFFGITNGRSCYCMPYMNAMESDSSMCESVCEGDTSTTCGGKTKSAIFEMHMCQQTQENLDSAVTSMQDMGEILASVHEKLDFTAKTMQTAGKTIQEAYGQVGDVAASALAQAAKVHAGKLQEAADASATLSGEMEEMQKKSSKVKVGSTASVVDEVEAMTSSMQEATTKADLEAQDMAKLLLEATPDMINATANVTDMYKPVMYFVDKAYLEVPTTCSGALLNSPMIGTLEGCAKACEKSFEDCVGFTWFPNHHLCFTFSEMRSTMYYTATGCAKPGSEEAPTCMVKFSKFSGTTLKPDPSGKCKGCLTTATEAARCPPPS
jgi:hypothetical protein